MQRTFFALIFGLAACSSESKPARTSEVVEVQPLALDAFEWKAAEVSSICDFQKNFVHWFVSSYTPSLKLKSEDCGNSRSGDIPEEFAEMNGKCAETCFVHVFTLTGDDANEYKLYSIVSSSDSTKTGFLSQTEFGSFLLYSKAGPYDASDYRKNVSYSPAENLLLMDLTFREALKSLESK